MGEFLGHRRGALLLPHLISAHSRRVFHKTGEHSNAFPATRISFRSLSWDGQFAAADCVRRDTEGHALGERRTLCEGGMSRTIQDLVWNAARRALRAAEASATPLSASTWAGLARVSGCAGGGGRADGGFPGATRVFGLGRSLRLQRIGIGQQVQPALARRDKLVPVVLRDRQRPRKLQRLEVTVVAVLDDAEIEMRPGGESRHADQPDALALLDALSRADQ